jgi:hypothetical protein
MRSSATFSRNRRSILRPAHSFALNMAAAECRAQHQADPPAAGRIQRKQRHATRLRTFFLATSRPRWRLVLRSDQRVLSGGERHGEPGDVGDVGEFDEDEPLPNILPGAHSLMLAVLLAPLLRCGSNSSPIWRALVELGAFAREPPGPLSRPIAPERRLGRYRAKVPSEDAGP